MPDVHVNGTRLYVEEHGEGPPILCIHGTGSSASVWRDAAVDRLAGVGRAIIYDRRGCARSERPEPYSTSVREQAEDAAQLLEALEASPAIVIGRSYGGAVALQLAVDHADRVRALVLLEAHAPAFDTEARERESETRRIVEAAVEDDPTSAASVLFRRELGDEAWEAFSEETRAMFTANSPAVLAEMRGSGLQADVEDMRAIKVPTLLVGSEEGPTVYRSINGRLEELIPLARPALVPGGHLVDPGAPPVLDFIREVAASEG